MPLCHLAQRLQKLPHAFPQCPLCGSRIVHDLRRRIEAHGGPAAEVVLRPTGVSRRWQTPPRRRAWCRRAAAAGRSPAAAPSRCRACRRRRRSRAHGTRRGVRRTAVSARQTRTYRWPSGALRVGVGQADGGDAPVPVGLDRREQVAGAGVGMCRAIGGQRRFDREPVGRHSSGQGLGRDVLDRATGHQEQSPCSSVFVPTMRSMSAPAPAAMRSIGRAGMTSPSTTGCHGSMLATTSPPQRSGSGCAARSALQLRLGPKQALDGDRRDRLSGCFDAKLLGEVLADPPRGRG